MKPGWVLAAELCYGLNYVPPQRHVDVWSSYCIPYLEIESLQGNKGKNDVFWVSSNAMNDILIKGEDLDAGMPGDHVAEWCIYKPRATKVWWQILEGFCPPHISVWNLYPPRLKTEPPMSLRQHWGIEHNLISFYWGTLGCSDSSDKTKTWYFLIQTAGSYSSSQDISQALKYVQLTGYVCLHGAQSDLVL